MICFVLGAVVTIYYYRVIRRKKFKPSPIAYKGEQWFHIPKRLRVPMWVAGGFSAASFLELVFLLGGAAKLSEHDQCISPYFSMVQMILLYLLEPNHPVHPIDSQRKYPSFLLSIGLGFALAVSVLSRF